MANNVPRSADQSAAQAATAHPRPAVRHIALFLLGINFRPPPHRVMTEKLRSANCASASPLLPRQARFPRQTFPFGNPPLAAGDPRFAQSPCGPRQITLSHAVRVGRWNPAPLPRDSRGRPRGAVHVPSAAENRRACHTRVPYPMHCRFSHLSPHRHAGNLN